MKTDYKLLISLLLTCLGIGFIYEQACQKVIYADPVLITPIKTDFGVKSLCRGGIGQRIGLRIGQASYYDYPGSLGQLVCASRDFKRGSKIRVRNLENGKEVVCLITDFGPSASVFPERIVDLSSYSFSQIGNLRDGVIRVSVEPVEKAL